MSVSPRGERLETASVWDSGPPVLRHAAPSSTLGPAAEAVGRPELEATPEHAAPEEALSAPVDPPPAPPVEPVSAVAAPLVKVHINATPWAEIEVDGRPVGVTPLGNVAMGAGPHEFLARFPDGRVITRSVTVSDTHRRVSFESD